ncbi:hypothetical protein [Sphingomonas beigongshangi]|uniref:hypothetical protein n=1 Tax=Sphingomonas beigongshangi TaxID=2782540 RepID=UPI00193BA9A0|nr:hypothetical protein [Sphingomonas beigongshangi]
MIRPDIDGRMAMRLREIAALEVDTVEVSDGARIIMSGTEKGRIINLVADLLEEYIMERKA